MDPSKVSKFYKDSESAIRFILAYVQFEKSVPKVRKKSIFFGIFGEKIGQVAIIWAE